MLLKVDGNFDGWTKGEDKQYINIIGHKCENGMQEIHAPGLATAETTPVKSVHHWRPQELKSERPGCHEERCLVRVRLLPRRQLDSDACHNSWVIWHWHCINPCKHFFIHTCTYITLLTNIRKFLNLTTVQTIVIFTLIEILQLFSHFEHLGFATLKDNARLYSIGSWTFRSWIYTCMYTVQCTVYVND